MSRLVRDKNKTLPRHQITASQGHKSEPFSWVEIDLGCLRHNLKQICAHTQRNASGVMAIVKADAYGHGMPVVAKTLYGEGVRFFGVANLDEAMQLNQVCPQAKILVLGSFHASQVPDYVAHGIRPTISCQEDLNIFEKNVSRGKHPVHVKIDSGMSRLGVWHEQALNLFKGALGKKSLEIEGVYTHFSSADEKNGAFTSLQMHRFETVLEKLGQMGIKPRFIHSANSLASTLFPDARFDFVRPGIMLYGLNPAKDHPPALKLKPVLSLKAKISFLKEVPAEIPLSYGRTYMTKHSTLIATIPMGYSHGYRVGFSNNGFVLVRGKRCPVVGRVTMDQTLVDVGDVPGVKRWDVATLIGKDGAMSVKAEELAESLGTIPYEIVCAIHSRIPRIYKGL